MNSGAGQMATGRPGAQNTMTAVIESTIALRDRMEKIVAAARQLASQVDGVQKDEGTNASKEQIRPVISSLVDQMNETIGSCHNWANEIELQLQRIGSRL